MLTAYVTIGNSDNKLTQAEWSSYAQRVEAVCQNYAKQLFIVGYSLQASPYQNMIIGLLATESALGNIRRSLQLSAQSYRQDSIALAVLDKPIEMIRPASDF